eukprot:CAMPEP_0177657656 /NCGR_PEP_ID=MMETSP0447-20121125/16322_1 /TAXON_ID=0 /ORGANISM="Stygamoeba regulata, Strain BSH-02190019" /LENGTH=447 /DNA_ID=CAMNT_0019162067 /DNA_START=17 /DNA_END=1358 /DNA_ORIENTATION=-
MAPLPARLLSAALRLPRLHAYARCLSTAPPKPLRLALIAGDGTGHVTVPCAQKVLASVELGERDIEFVPLDAGFETFQRTGHALPASTLQDLRGCDGALFGAVSSPLGFVEGYKSPIIAIRQELGLFASLRPLRGVAPSGARVDCLVVRENTEDLFASKERLEQGGEVAVVERTLTRAASRRIAESAFHWARKRASHRQQKEALDRSAGMLPRPPRPARVTIVHKANVLSMSDGLFLETCREVSRLPENEGVQTDDMLVDIAAHELVRCPDAFDVLLTPNLYGDILSDVGAALVGGIHVVPTANTSDSFVLAHGSNIVTPASVDKSANPLATIRAGAVVLFLLHETGPAMAIEKAVQATIEQGPFTPDMGGIATAEEVTRAVVKRAQYFQFMATMPGESDTLLADPQARTHTGMRWGGGPFFLFTLLSAAVSSVATVRAWAHYLAVV